MSGTENSTEANQAYMAYYQQWQQQYQAYYQQNPEMYEQFVKYYQQYYPNYQQYYQQYFKQQNNNISNDIKTNDTNNNSNDNSDSNNVDSKNKDNIMESNDVITNDVKDSQGNKQSGISHLNTNDNKNDAILNKSNINNNNNEINGNNTSNANNKSKKKKKKKRKKKQNDNDNNIIKKTQGMAAFLNQFGFNNNNKSNNNANMNTNKNENNINDTTNNETKKRELQGETHDIQWEYRNKPYNKLIVNINDIIHFKWKKNQCRNVWSFGCKSDFDNNQFVMREWHEKASCNVREYKFHCQKPGIFYFGCQIGNCVKGGNMKIAIHVKDGNNPTKKRRLE